MSSTHGYIKDTPKFCCEQCRMMKPTCDVCKARNAEIARLKGEVERLNAWVNDLQSGMYINCVYCGHRYGPQDKVPCSMAEALKKHIEQCPKHPMSALKQDLAAAKAEVERLRGEVKRLTNKQDIDWAKELTAEIEILEVKK